MMINIKYYLFGIILSCFSTTTFSQTVGIKVVSNGNVGIGVSSPQEKLDINGAISIENTSTPCTAASAGTIRWNGTCFEGCDGTSWVGLSNTDACGGAIATCTDGIMNQGETDVDCGGPCAPCNGGTCQTGCECFPDIPGIRDLPNTGWNNEFNVGGTGISGDGELCFTIGSITNYSRQVIGLDDSPSQNGHYNLMRHGIMVLAISNRFRVGIVENGVFVSGWVYDSSVSFSNSTLCIRRTGSTVEYLMDGNILHSSSGSSGQLFFDNSFFDSPQHYLFGVRPSEFYVNNIQICPNGTNSNLIDHSNTRNSLSKQIEEEEEREKLVTSKFKTTNSEGLEIIFQDPFILNAALENKVNLGQNIPNPFDTQTDIELYLPDMYEQATLEIYSNYGSLLKTINLTDIGIGKVNLETEELSSGVYTYLLRIDGNIVDSKRMVKAK